MRPNRNLSIFQRSGRQSLRKIRYAVAIVQCSCSFFPTYRPWLLYAVCIHSQSQSQLHSTIQITRWKNNTDTVVIKANKFHFFFYCVFLFVLSSFYILFVLFFGSLSLCFLALLSRSLALMRVYFRRYAANKGSVPLELKDLPNIGQNERERERVANRFVPALRFVCVYFGLKTEIIVRNVCSLCTVCSHDGVQSTFKYRAAFLFATFQHVYDTTICPKYRTKVVRMVFRALSPISNEKREWFSWELKYTVLTNERTYALPNEKRYVIRHLANLKMRCICSQAKIMLMLSCLQITLISSCCAVVMFCLPTEWFFTVSPFPSFHYVNIRVCSVYMVVFLWFLVLFFFFKRKTAWKSF